jgi:hypothetical protein
MPTHYDTLHVDPSAGADQIRESYRAHLQLVHPDRHQGASPEVVRVAEAETERLVEAFRVLSDPQRRAAYDQSLHQSHAYAGAGWGAPGPSQPRSDPSAGATQPPGGGSRTNGASAHSGTYGHRAPVGGWTRYPCPGCGHWQLGFPGAAEVTCEQCSTKFVFVTCKACHARIPVRPTDQWSRCGQCSRKRITPWASAETKRNRLLIQFRNGVLMLAIPIAILVIVAMRVNRLGSPDGVAYWLVAALTAMCIGLYITFVVVRRNQHGQDGASTPPR